MTWSPDQVAGGRFVGAGVAAAVADGAGAGDAGAPDASADDDGVGDGAEAAGALQAARSRAMVRIASDRGVRYMIIPIWSVPAGRRPHVMTHRGVGCVAGVTKPTRASGVCQDRVRESALEPAGVTRRGLVLFGLMSVIWGIPYLFIRVAVAEITPAMLVLGRTALAAVILLPIALARVDLRPILARWRWVVAFAAIEIAIPWIALGSAERHLSSSLTGLLIAGVPLVGTTLALATGGADRLGRAGLLGLLIGLVGVAAIVGGDYATSDPTALLQIVVVVVGYAVGPAILARRLGGLPTVGVMALSLALCAVVYIPIAAADIPSVMPSTNVVASVVILAVVCTAVAFLVFAALIDEVGPVRATVITYVNPAVAAVLGVLVLNEQFSAAMAIGFALVILGSALATRPSRRAEAPRHVAAEEALRP